MRQVMSTDNLVIGKIIEQVSHLSIHDRVLLSQQLVEQLVTNKPTEPYPLWRYGIFNVGRLSNEDDFQLAEWYPTNEELDG